jgi:hypothetical protein
MKHLEFKSTLLESYFSLLQNFSDSAKQSLIDKLKKSMDKKPREPLDLFGAWAGDESAEEIIDSIR